MEADREALPIEDGRLEPAFLEEDASRAASRGRTPDWSRELHGPRKSGRETHRDELDRPRGRRVSVSGSVEIAEPAGGGLPVDRDIDLVPLSAVARVEACGEQGPPRVGPLRGEIPRGSFTEPAEN